MRSLVGYGLLAPPNLFIVLCLLGSLISLIWRRVGIAIALAASICLFVAATPLFSAFLEASLQSQIPNDTDFGSAQAIVVLGGDAHPNPDRLGPLSLERVFMAADAYHTLRLPV